jgi:Uma2 family endonuclease
MTAELAAPNKHFTTFKVVLSPSEPLVLLAQGMTRDAFLDFCQANDALRIERNPDGNLTIMPPTGLETGRRNAEICAELTLWNRQSKLGVTFDSSTGFTLPNGAERAPDAAWLRLDRWTALPAEEKQRFARIVPDFVLELRSEGQSLSALREKMDEYMEAGCRLAWLIDPQNRRCYAYFENGDIQTIPFDAPLHGASVMPGLSIRLADFI